MSHVLRWEGPEHPVIEELRARPGEWAVLYEDDDRPEGWPETKTACLRHVRVETETLYSQERAIVGARARWIPDAEWAGIQAVRRYAREVSG